jgi:glycosyltransferase involved in cell wall biosynthesis
MAKVSIVLPTYNAARYLREAVDSCLNQTHRDIELICVDGGSTDGTLKILDEYVAQDPRVSIVHQPANSGKLPGALSLGFRHSTGEYLEWMQADSLYAPHAIATLIEHLEKYNADFVYANYWVIDPDGKIIESVKVGQVEEIKQDNPFGMCHLWRRRVYDALGDHNVKAFLAEDYEYWCRIYQHGFKMHKIDEFLYYWRRHPDSLSFRDYGLFESMRQAARIRQRLVNPDFFNYARAMSQLYIDEAFARHAYADAPGTRRAVLQGIRYNPAWLFNRGVLVIFLRALSGHIEPHLESVNWPPYKGRLE